MPALSAEVFQTLLAIGWIDGSLDPDEAGAILMAAREAGLDEAAMASLVERSRAPVDFADMDLSRLDRDQRLYVYAVASWVARVDNEVTREESAGLHAVATVLGITGKGRRTMDDVVEQLRGSAHAPARLDLVGLRAHIEAAVQRATRPAPEDDDWATD